jgi:hypothetical protein
MDNFDQLDAIIQDNRVVIRQVLLVVASFFIFIMLIMLFVSVGKL